MQFPVVRQGVGGNIVRCLTCGLRRLDPRPADPGEIYQDDYYAYVGRTRAPWKQATWERLRDLTEVPAARVIPRWVFDVNPPARGTVVDIGCGYGDLIAYLKSRGASVLGIELSAAAVRAAAELGAPVVLGDPTDLALDDRSVDIAVLQHSLEHFPDPEAAIREVARILKPDGQVHIAVPNGGSAGLRVQTDAWGCLDNPKHFWYFDLASLSALLARHGLGAVRTSSKTIWANHRNLWRATGWPPREIAAYLRARTRAGSGDTLRIVARAAG